MNDSNQLASTGSLFADPTRAEILVLLMDGKFLSASELALHTHVSSATISHHLSILLDAGFITVQPMGRFRYHKLASTEIAELIEHVGTAGMKNVSVKPRRNQVSLAHCRTCYSHLAGKVGVAIREELELSGCVAVINESYQVQNFNSPIWEALEVTQSDGLRGKLCLDWTERKPHIGGELGRVIWQQMMKRGWMARTHVPRQLQITPLGQEALKPIFPSLFVK